MKGKSEVCIILCLLLLVLPLVNSTKVVGATTDPLHNYLRTYNYNTYKDSNGKEQIDMYDTEGYLQVIYIAEVKKPVYIVAECKGKLYGYKEHNMAYTASFLGDNGFTLLEVGDSTNAASIGSELKSKGVGLLTSQLYEDLSGSSGALPISPLIRITKEGVDAEKFHVYDENGSYIGSYSWKSFIDSTYSEKDDTSILGNGKGIVKVEKIEYSKDKTSANVTISWDFTGVDGEHYQDIEVTMKDKNGDFISSQNSKGSTLPGEDEVGLEKATELRKKSTMTLHYTASGIGYIEVFSNLNVYVLEPEINLKDGVSPNQDSVPVTTPEEEQGALKVTFEPMSKKVLAGTPTKVVMHTNIDAVKTFGGQYDGVLSKVSNFVVTENGDYNYKAETKSGKKVTGVFKVTCFVDDTGSLALADYFSDPNAPASSGELPQTGGISWQIYMYVGIGVVLIAIIIGFIAFKNKKRV